MTSLPGAPPPRMSAGSQSLTCNQAKHQGRLECAQGFEVVSLAEAGLRGRLREVRAYGKVLNSPAALKAMATKLAVSGNELRFCYDAGPCPPARVRHSEPANRGRA